MIRTHCVSSPLQGHQCETVYSKTVLRAMPQDRAMHSLKSLHCMVRFPAGLTIQASVVGKANGNVREIT